MAAADSSWSLATHLCGFVFIFPIGLRRLLSLYSYYLKTPQAGDPSSLSPLSVFRAKPWYYSATALKNLDLYILLIALPIASLSDLFLFLSLHRFSFLHHAALLSFFTLLLILRHHFFLPDTFLFLFSAVALKNLILSNTSNFTGLITTTVYALSRTISLLLAASCIHLPLLLRLRLLPLLRHPPQIPLGFFKPD